MSAALRLGVIKKGTADAAHLCVLLVREENDIEMLAGVENRRKRRTDLRGKTAFIRALRLDAENHRGISINDGTRQIGLVHRPVLLKDLREFFLQLLLGGTILFAQERDLLNVKFIGRSAGLVPW